MVYHVYNKSIANFTIFNNKEEYHRIEQLLPYYRTQNQKVSYSWFARSEKMQSVACLNEVDRLVEIIAYCIMPTHLHMILKEAVDGGISIYTNNILNGYTRYFNIKHKRKGPLWEGRSKKVPVETDEQLLHLTRYVHLNPVTAYLANRPEAWAFSSYGEYVSDNTDRMKVCNYENLLNINPEAYAEFVNDRISYQRELAKIRHLLYE